MFTTLMYHLVDDDIHTPWSIPRASFKGQMKALAGMDVTILSQVDVNAILDGKMAAPRKGVFLTFDDGYLNTVTDVLPVLDKYGFSASIGVCSSYLLPRFRPFQTIHSSQEFATAPQLRDWLAGGRTIAGHTFDHPRLPEVNEEQLRMEIGADKLILEEIFEQTMDTFFYPSGLVSEPVVKMAAKYYRTAFITNQPEDGGLPSATNRHRILRVFIEPEWSDADFEAAMSTELAKVTG